MEADNAVLSRGLVSWCLICGSVCACVLGLILQGSECAVHLDVDHVTYDEAREPEILKGDIIHAIEMVQSKQTRLS